MQSPQGVYYKRNLQHVKPFLKPDREDRESTLQAPEAPNKTKATELPPVEEVPVPMAESPPLLLLFQLINLGGDQEEFQ